MDVPTRQFGALGPVASNIGAERCEINGDAPTKILGGT